MNTDTILVALAWLGTYLVHSTLLLGTVALLVRGRMLRQPRLVERMWKAAALGGILTATAQVCLVSTPALGSLSLRSMVAGHAAQPAGVESTPRDAAPSPRAARPAVSPAGRPAAGPAPAARVSERSPWPATPRTGRPSPSLTAPGSAPRDARDPVVAAGPTPPEATDASASTGSPGGPLAGTAVTTLPNSAQPLPWKPAVVTTWAIVGGWGLLGFLFAWSRLFSRLSDRRVLKSGLLVDCLAELCRRAGVQRRVRLTASGSIDSPITHGWIRREICVPERALTELSRSQLESTLAHELAHVLRRDPLWFGTLALLERVLFFQPLNRMARRQLQEIAEFVCDDWAVRWTGGRLALASALTEIAHWIVGRRQLALPSPGMASSRLGDRVERLLDDQLSRAPEPARVWLPPAALGTLGLVVLAVPGVSSATPASAPPASSSPGLAADAVAADETPAELRFAFPPTEYVPPARTSSFGIHTDQELLDDELQLLQAELDQLRAELDESELYDQFEHAFEDITRRMNDLRSRKERLNALLARVLSERETHDDDETP